MALEFDIPRLTYDQIREKAEDFLTRYHPGRDIPIPIEEIVEFELGLDIVPVPGLHQVLDVDGFTYGDRTAIAIDQFIYEHRVNRYRFTLAHEAGHLFLHPQSFEFFRPRTISEYKSFVQSLPESLHSRMEYQAYSFAGLALVPKGPLEREVRAAIKKIIQVPTVHEVDPTSHGAS